MIVVKTRLMIKHYDRNRLGQYANKHLKFIQILLKTVSAIKVLDSNQQDSLGTN